MSFSDIYLNLGANFIVLGRSEKLLLGAVALFNNTIGGSVSFAFASPNLTCTRVHEAWYSGLKSAVSDCSSLFPWVFSWLRLR